MIRSIRPCGIGVERILTQNRVGERTPSVLVANDIATALDKVLGYFTVLAGARLPNALDLKPETRHLKPCLRAKRV